MGAALTLVGARMQATGQWVAWRGVGLAFGIGAAGCLLALWAYVLPKRGLAWWQRRKANAPAADNAPVPTRSLVRPHLLVHVALGFIALGVVVAHGGLNWSNSAGAALSLSFFITAATGALATLCYAIVPRRLSRLEVRAHLPEDYAQAKRELHDRLYSSVTGKSEVVKRLLVKVLVPYRNALGGWLWLTLSGRNLREERERLRQRIDAILQGRQSERLAGLTELIRIVVEARALPAQRYLTLLMRVWLPLHVVLASMAALLLVLHMIEVAR